MNTAVARRTQMIEKSSSTYVRFLLSLGDFGNFSGVLSPDLRQEIKNSARIAQEHIDSNREREVACANCGIRCKHVYPNPDGGYTFMKCQDWFAPMTATQIFDCDFAIAYMSLCEKYGLDLSTTANCIAFA